MAGFQKKKELMEPSTCNIAFDCDLNPSSRGVIVNELIKYCMYEREQIPLHFENLKDDARQNHENENSCLQNTTKNTRQSQLLKKVKERKSEHTLSCLEQLFDNLSEMFKRYPEVHRVMILLGGTVISPKETYTVNLPPTCPDAEPPTGNSYVKYLYRQLIMQNIFGRVKSISPTSMTVLVHAPRDCGIEWFLPKPAFKIPQRSRQFVFNIVCNKTSSSSHNLTLTDDEFDISGIQPLTDISSGEMSSSSMFDSDGLFVEDSLGIADTESVSVGSNYTPSCIYSSKYSSSQQRHSSSKLSQTEVAAKHIKLINNDSGFDSTEGEMMWFQSPVVVKGYNAN